MMHKVSYGHLWGAPQRVLVIAIFTVLGCDSSGSSGQRGSLTEKSAADISAGNSVANGFGEEDDETSAEFVDSKSDREVAQQDPSDGSLENDEVSADEEGAMPPESELLSFQIAPPEGISNSSPNFEWGIAHPAAEYTVVIGKDSQCIDATQELAGIKENQVEFHDLAEDSYFVCISASHNGFQRTADNSGLPFSVLRGWKKIVAKNGPPNLMGASAIWTGEEVIVWGGQGNSGGIDRRQAGYKFDPAKSQWTTISSTNAPEGRHLHSAVWTDTDMIVWGGSTVGPDGGKYNPKTDTWQPFVPVSWPHQFSSTPAVWTGDSILAQGGWLSTKPVGGSAEGYRYDPGSNAWTAVSALSNAGVRSSALGVWTGSQYIIWGDFVSAADSGFIYDYANKAGASFSFGAQTPIVGRGFSASGYLEGKIYMFGGLEQGSFGRFSDAGVYDLQKKSWKAIDMSGGPEALYGTASVFTKQAWFIFGGMKADDTLASESYLYYP